MSMSLKRSRPLAWLLLVAVVISFVFSPLLTGYAQAGTADEIVQKVNTLRPYLDQADKDAIKAMTTAWGNLDSNSIDSILEALATPQAVTKSKYADKNAFKAALAELILDFAAVDNRASMVAYYNKHKVLMGNLLFEDVDAAKLWTLAQKLEEEYPKAIIKMANDVLADPLSADSLAKIPMLLPLLGGSNADLIGVFSDYFKLALDCAQDIDSDFKDALTGLGWSGDLLTAQEEVIVPLVDQDGDAQLAALLLLLRSQITMGGTDGANISSNPQRVNEIFTNGTLTVPQSNEALNIDVLLAGTGYSLSDVEEKILQSGIAQLQARKIVVWHSSDTSVAAVNTAGKLVPSGVGTSVITLVRNSTDPSEVNPDRAWLYRFTLTVNAPGTTHNANFTVTNAAGNPLAATVTVTGQTSVTAGTTGQATIPNLLPGSYSYTVQMTGYNQATGNFTINNQDVSIAVTLTTGGGGGGGGGGATTTTTYTATFNVTNTADEPIDGANIATDNRNFPTNDAGSASVTGLSTGRTYDYTVSHPDYNDASGQIVIAAANVTEDVVLTIRIPLTAVSHSKYISGRDGNNVAPDSSITRAEAAMIFFNISNYGDRAAAAQQVFSDVAVGEWYAQAVSTLYNRGVLTGYGDGTFRPQDSITRAELTTMAVQYAGLTAGEGTYDFGDLDSSHWAYPYIMAAADRSWITGYTDNTFAPNNTITRAETIVIVNRMLERKIDKADLPTTGLQQFNDLTSSHWAYAEIMEAANDHNYTRKYPDSSTLDELWVTGDQTVPGNTGDTDETTDTTEDTEGTTEGEETDTEQ